MRTRHYYTYIMTNRAGTPYVGVTSDLEKRVYEHKTGSGSRFTSRYKVDQLVYYEETNEVGVAIAREKQIKGWLRRKKVELIEAANPLWVDMSEGWYSVEPDSSVRSE